MKLEELKVGDEIIREDGEQVDGWPCGDEVTMKCKDCGLVFTCELPQ